MKIIADGHFAAETIASIANRHFGSCVRRGLHKHWNRKIGHAQRVGDGALVAEIRKCYDDAVDRIAMFFEKIGALRGFLTGFDRAVFGIRFAERDYFHAGSFKRGNHFLASATREMIRKKSAIADNNS